MDIFAAVVRGLIAPAWAVWERSPYLWHYRRLLRTQFDSPSVIRCRQWDVLMSLLSHAYETTSFWRQRFDTANLKPGDILSFDDFTQVPLLTKEDIRTHVAELISDEYDQTTLHRAQTSGSTGVPLEIFQDDARHEYGRACTLRSDEWSGWRLGQRVGAIWGNAAAEFRGNGWRGYLRNALLNRITYLDSLKIDEQSLGVFAAALRKRPPSLLYGHAHSLYLFARYLEGHSQFDIRPRGIISAAMVLHEWERQVIEHVFQCPVTNRYGCEEVGLIACECEQHRGLHVNADTIHLEIVRADGTPANPGESGMIVITDLWNRAMPIIRYQLGDMGRLTDRICPCGRGLPLLEEIQGRIADYVVTRSGKFISGISLTDHFNTKVPGVVQMQIVQEEIDRFVLRIVKTHEFGPQSLETIRNLVDEHFGPECRHECEFVDSIPQEPSGKFRFCISKVERPFM